MGKIKKLSIIVFIVAMLCLIGYFKPEINEMENSNLIVPNTPEQKATGEGDNASTFRIGDGEEITVWNIDEFETWMTNKLKECQQLVDIGSKTYYYKNEDGIYIAREWRQSDVDELRVIWEKQLERMKNGYIYTKDNNGGLIGEYGPIK